MQLLVQNRENYKIEKNHKLRPLIASTSTKHDTKHLQKEYIVKRYKWNLRNTNINERLILYILK